MTYIHLTWMFNINIDVKSIRPLIVYQDEKIIGGELFQ